MYEFFNDPQIKYIFEQMAKIPTNPQNMRSERKQKLKRVFNYDAEMNFLKSYWNLKGKSMSVEDFIEFFSKIMSMTSI